MTSNEVNTGACGLQQTGAYLQSSQCPQPLCRIALIELLQQAGQAMSCLHGHQDQCSRPVL